MSDPYNSYGSSLPPVAPAAPRAVAMPQPHLDRISELNVSDSWKRKLRLIEKAGGPDFPNRRNLTARERLSAGFNVLAFLFGPIYLVIKGLWRQAIVYVLLVIALALLLEMMGLGKLMRGIGSTLSIIFSMRANAGYYAKVVLGKASWV
ncbi:DUF2628 domain-containing protein [Marilutibacter alkalisoli]|uniref:DUF2628 domain-containing protein n=1 Tax=Marilutibacter alkalisoli TaxID=2591633 RepID=A0A514BRQ1_9GAMM|nr:DUF2628 domain-containing protein [Lysobacter alkalisoli]QDH70051.1 DUF2628 domain-containing protein [Lysobacter alkalisoli]